MATVGESSSASSKSTNGKTVIVRVKRKSYQSRLDAFWLEINERPWKRQLVDFEKLSISDSVDGKVEELRPKKVFVQHVETVTSSEATIDFVQSFVSNMTDVVEGEHKCDVPKRIFKKENKQMQLLSKSRQNQEVLAKNARFEQIWKSRSRDKEALQDKQVHEMCHFYDIVRVDVEERSNEVLEQEVISLEDQRMLCSYLPLLREFIPSAAEEIESDMQAYMDMSKKDDYVYDYYTMKDDKDIGDEDASSPFPLVKVEDEDFFDGLDDDSEYNSEDSNAEAHPRHDYPDEPSEEDEVESDASTNESEKEGSDAASNKSSELEDLRHNLTEDVDQSYEDEIYDDYSDDGDDFDHDDDRRGNDEDWRWSYR